jgi:hypothetical protein
MVLLNMGLCLPIIEVEALAQGQMIVAVPQRFIVPGKRFVLYPSKAVLNDLRQEDMYNSSFLKKFSSETNIQAENSIKVWARCDFCQHFINQEKVFALTQNTIWSKDALEKYLRNRGNLFMAFLRIYRLSNLVDLDEFSQNNQLEKIGKFVPLSQYLDVDEQNPVLEDHLFEELKQILIDLKIDSPKVNNILNEAVENNVSQEELLVDTSEVTAKDTSVLSEDISLVTKSNLIDEPNWFTRIAEIGNSSDGYTFEKLVRKSFITLGFSNSLNNSKISLDPNSTGGAGGLDFYCDQPYQVVGECKATKSEKVPASTPTQLIALGHKYLQDSYLECVKVIVVAGKLTSDAYLTAQNNRISVLRPEILQRLVELKIAYPGAFNLFQLKPLLDTAPFGEAVDQKLSQFVNEVWQKLTLRSLLVEAVRKLFEVEGKPISPQMVRIHFNAALAQDQFPLLQDNGDTRDLLIELSSPLTGYLGHKKIDEIDNFYFIRELKIED